MAKTIRIDRTSWGGSQRDNRQNQIAALPPNHSIPIVAVMATATDHSSQVSNEWSNDATCNGKSAIEATRTSGQFNPMLPPPRRLLLTVPQPMTINPSVSANAFEAFLVKPHVPTPASSSSVPVNVFELPEHGTRVREQQIQPEMESLRLLAERFAQTRLDFQVSSFPSVTASLLPQPQYEQALLRAMQAPTIEPTQLPSQSSVHSSLPSGNQMFIRQLDGLQVRATEEQASQATPQWPAGAAMASQEQERATATLIRAFAIPQTQEHQAPCQNFSPGAMVTGLPINAQRDQPYTQALQNRSLQAPYWPKGPTAPRTAPWSQAQTPIPQNSSHPASIVATQAPAPSTSQELDAVTIRRHINTLLQSLANQG